MRHVGCGELGEGAGIETETVEEGVQGGEVRGGEGGEEVVGEGGAVVRGGDGGEGEGGEGCGAEAGDHVARVYSAVKEGSI